MSPQQGEELYIEHLRALHRSPATISSIHRFMGWFILYLQKREIEDLRDVTLQHLLDYHGELRARRKPSGEPNSRAYCNAQLWYIAQMFHLLYQRGKLLDDPSRHLPSLSNPRQLPKAILSGEQINRILAQPRVSTLWGFRDRAMLELLYSSGLRAGEVVRLSVHDIDWKERTLRILQGKGRKDRLVPIGAVALRYLQEYVEVLRPVMLSRFAPGGPSRDKLPVITTIPELLFFSRRRTPMTRQYLRCIILGYAKKARITGRVTTHSVRHACATEMLKGGANVRHVQELLGHARLATTQIYTRVLPYDLKKVHARTAPSERRRIIKVPVFESQRWQDKKNAGHYGK
jgi:integrase/recombinase XerD